MSKNQIKERIRQTCLRTRRAVSSEAQSTASKKICAQIESSEIYQQAKIVALYSAINGEIKLEDLLSQNEQKTYCFPVIHNQTLFFLSASTSTPFLKNKFGILEPDVPFEFSINPLQLDIIFLPLVAFDEQGTRIGMGGGYYDRTLINHTQSLLIGVGYEFQKQDFIPPDPWDVALDGVITENKMYWFK